MKKKIVTIFVFLTMCKAEATDFGLEEHISRPLQQTQDEIIRETGLKTYRDINDVWSYPGPGESMEIKSDLWKMGTVLQTFRQDDKPLIARMRTFVLQEEPKSMCQAFDDLLRSCAKVDCTLALVTSQIFILRALMGEELFEHYAHLYYKSLPHKDMFFSGFPQEFLRVNGPARESGFYYHITSVSEYSKLCPDGFDAGHNVFCVGPDLYMGFGDLFKDGPRSEKDIAQALYESYMGVLQRQKEQNPSFHSPIESELTFHKHRAERQTHSRTKLHIRRKTYTENGLGYLIGDLMLAALE